MDQHHQLDVEIEKIVYGGDGLARGEKGTLFVPYTAPGDRVRVEVCEQRKGFSRARTIELLSASPDRREAPCRYYGRCGGCQLQHLTPEAQHRVKAEFIRESLARIARIEWTQPIPVIAGPEFGYRSRVRVQVDRRTQPMRVGFFESRSHRVCDVAECLLASDEVNGALKEFRANAHALSSGSEIEILAGSDGQVETVRHSEAPSARVAQRIGTRLFEYDSRSFFQVNRYLLGQLVEQACGGESGNMALDLYGGVGFFGAALADHFGRVISVEANSRAVRLARQNLSLSGVKNVESVTSDVAEWLRHQSRESLKSELALLDPPRTGAGEEVIRELLRLSPGRIAYVSCDPATLARDLKNLTASQYQIDSIVAIDLFPQTTHIETIVKLSRAQPV